MATRPWGPLDWALALTKPRPWEIVGTLGTEVRSLAAWKWLKELNAASHCRLFEIADVESRHTPRTRQLLRERRNEFVDAGGRQEQILPQIELLTELHRIVSAAIEIEKLTQGSIIVDITSLPKRFFFPLLRHLERSDRVSDLVLTYTSPESYIEDEPLSENPCDWLTLPGFVGCGAPPEPLIVSVGFMVESLKNHLATINKHEAIKLLIPFPAPLSILRRTWEAVYSVQSASKPEKFEHHRVDGADMPGAFERITSLARGLDRLPAFAPFGPKPISAAICLFAAQRECSVYYPQPRAYHPDYSQGVAVVGGKRAVHAYWIKHSGKRLYLLG